MFDQVASTLAFMGFSLPTLFTGLLFILVFSITLDWLPFVYRSDISATGWQWYWEHIRQAAMPVAVLGLFQAASWTRYVRAAVLDVIRLDYVTTARAKGLSRAQVIFKHALRNAAIPVVSIAAVQLGFMLGGSIVIETVFALHGVGFLGWESIAKNDFPVVQAVVLVLATLYIGLTLLADILNALLDPRLRAG